MQFWQEEGASGFDWDAGNREKVWDTHRVAPEECQEVFKQHPIFGGEDSKHSLHEERYYVYGQTKAGRRLFIIYTMRCGKIRVISARDMNQKERKEYDEAIERTA